MSQWQIKSDEYLDRLRLSKEDFKSRLHLPDVERVSKIIPLKNMDIIESLVPITLDMVVYLIKQVKTLDERLLFTNACIKMVKIDPRHLRIGQKFVYREKYQNLLENIPDMFHKFLVTNGGLADLSAYFVFGADKSGEYSMACYLPPLIEKHNMDLVIMDGIHRNYIVRQSGLTLNAILIEGVDLPFPCSAREWTEVGVVSLTNKPKILHERYFDLKEELFRDLKYLGIDG